LAPGEEAAIQIANSIVGNFQNVFEAERLSAMRGKFGLLTEEDGDIDLIEEFLALLARREADFTLSFRRLSALAEGTSENSLDLLAKSLGADSAWNLWKPRWTTRLERQAQSRKEAARQMRAHNPTVIPRNHSVERAIQGALSGEHINFMHDMVEALAKPFEDRPEGSKWTIPPRPEDRVTETFCGT
jgi:uncharacterized protein YdiU (UPF0061 family)